jgi:imidazolonepropionase-like amidohydrolase
MRKPWFLVVAAVTLFTAGTRADAPHVYAVTDVRIVTAAGAPIASGTVVIRNGLIEALGSTVAPPGDARVIRGEGLVVYPGLIDMGTTTAVDVPSIPRPEDPETREDVDRWRRSVILQPQLSAADHIQVDAPELTKFAAAGITTVLATPPGDIFRGHSALVNVVAPEEDPQIGDIAATRRGLIIINPRVALHVSFRTASSEATYRSYPDSPMGVMAFIRQAFLDAQHYQLQQRHYARVTTGVNRPVYDPALAAMQAAVEGQLAVAFEANLAREILRALGLARELGLDPIITGGHEADQVSADLQDIGARVIFSLDYTTRPENLAPDADEPLRVLRARANAPKVPAALEQAGILFAFESGNLEEPEDFVQNAARAVEAGLAADAAVRALTINAARIAGVDARLGSIEPGKIANLIVTDGDLFGEDTAIQHVFIDGRLVELVESEDTATEDTAEPPEQRRQR